MKQMSLIEMDGFLKGKCIPSDLKVNETNAEYLVRKFAEAEAKCAALAAENAGIKSAIPESRDIEDDNDNMDDVSLAEDFGFNHAIERMRRQIPETPTTDAFLAEVRAQGVDAAIEAAKNLVAQEYEYKDFKAAQSDCCMYPGSDLVGKVEMTEWLVDFAAQLRKGGGQK
ncbi:hNH endonuclease [Escherichia coli]|uniref:ead/Ea22-like family protein n=1 Tax=Escherichia coli TaxID=562 RepID=UPI0013753CC1|nr:ead/Ea22-like family protein [Escherichia coli]MCQ5681935.1 hNH endonuclease [Escherichia coli]MCQ5723684.1 hNH endonuclease [Escherichia coli]MCQ5730012.1 hNH endonuclease [Escherichia coli]MCQ6058445.1 hNH endonuclease [Escherichia coli]MCQ6075020.1 hNH endonuclease [Escherichia coli]